MSNAAAPLPLSAGSWDSLAGTNAAGEAVALNVGPDGACGRDEAARHCPVGSHVACTSPEGTRVWRVDAHDPHPGGHPNWVVPSLSLVSGPSVPGEGGRADDAGRPVALDAGPRRRWEVPARAVPPAGRAKEQRR